MDLSPQGERVDISIEDFDRPAKEFRGPWAHVLRQHVERYRWAGNLVGARVLDVACGTGYGSAYLSRHAESVVGLDRNAEAVQLARARAPSAEIVQHELPTLPFDDESFDSVVSFETVEHIAEDHDFLTEIGRVLRPGGSLLISSPVRAEARDTRPDNPWHVREYTVDEFVQLVSSAAFVDIAQFGQGVRTDGLLGHQIHRVVARFPLLCRPGRWWDDAAHGDDAVFPLSPGGGCNLAVLFCRRL